jgi:hypothetical protein
MSTHRLSLVFSALLTLSAAARAQYDGPVQPRELPPDRARPDEPVRYEKGGDQDAGLPADLRGDPYFLGFAGGAYRPADGEKLDPELALRIATGPRPGESAAFTYGYVMFEGRITDEKLDKVRALGATPLHYHPNNAYAARLPVARCFELSQLPEVRWVGFARQPQKLHPVLRNGIVGRTIAPATPELPGAIPVWIGLFESELTDASVRVPLAPPVEMNADGTPKPGNPEAAGFLWETNGRGKAALERLGFRILEYSEPARAYRALATPAALADALALDFVTFAHWAAPNEAGHDWAVPQMGQDYERDRFPVRGPTVGVIDSGFALWGARGPNTGHVDLNKNAVGWDLWGGGCGSVYCDEASTGFHGSHVLGSVCGLGSAIFANRGFSPYVGNNGGTQRIFLVKGLTTNAFQYMRNNYTDGGGAITPRPPIVSNSWRSVGCIGGQAANYIGSEAQAIALDQEVFDRNQLYVFCAGNEGNCNGGCGVARTIGDPATAKNTLAVGMVNDYVGTEGDPGAANCGSSRGPAGDGRWKPNVVASGCSINSVDGSTTNGYSQKCGCSMATPITSAILSAAAERYPELRSEGALARAWAMGTAVTWQDATSPGAWGGLSPAHTFNYGLGRISALKAVEGGGGLPWFRNWGWGGVGTAPVTYDIAISAGCTRLVVVLTWNDVPPALGANPVIVKDVDLHVDREPFDPGGNTGEYWSNSVINSVEYVFVNNPPAGNYRIKLYPYTPQHTVRFGMMACQLYGDTTPVVSLSGATSRAWIRPGQSVSVPVTVAASDYLATNVYLTNPSTLNGFNLSSTSTTLQDGTLLTNRDSGGEILLGDVLRGTPRVITYTFTEAFGLDRVASFAFRTRSDNAGISNHAANLGIDGTPPRNVSVSINGGAANVASLDVTLTIAAIDDFSGMSLMRFRNDGGSFSAWEPFATSRPWNLASGGGSSATGTRTVWMEVQDTAGNPAAAFDSIYHYVPPVAFGNACAGSLGLPTFAVSGVPGIGSVVTFQIGSTAASTAQVWLGVSSTTWNGLTLPYDLAPYGVPGCALNVSLDAPLYQGPPGSIPFAIPFHPALAGQVIHFQALLYGDPGGRLVVTTRGLRVTIAGA